MAIGLLDRDNRVVQLDQVFLLDIEQLLANLFSFLFGRKCNFYEIGHLASLHADSERVDSSKVVSCRCRKPIASSAISSPSRGPRSSRRPNPNQDPSPNRVPNPTKRLANPSPSPSRGPTSHRGSRSHG